MKLTAITIVDDKFWVVEDKEGKIGVLRFNNDTYTFHHTSEGDTTLTESEFKKKFKVVANKNKDDTNTAVYGYPSKVPDPVDIGTLDNGVPTYRKSEQSTVVYAAGWYALYFPTTKWTESFCPRVSTLETYNYIGPFKSKADLNIAIKRKHKEEK